MMGGFFGGSSAPIYDLAFSAAGKPVAAAELPPFVFIREGSVPLNFEGSRAYAKIAPTADAVFSVQKDGVQFGTITFLAGQHWGVFVCAVTDFVLESILTIVAPAIQDATLAQIGINLLVEVY